MAARFACFRRGQSIIPCDDDGRDVIRALSPRRPVMVEVQQRRNVQQHRLYWALITKVYDNLPLHLEENFGSKEALSDAIKITVGYYEDMVDLTTGKGSRRAKSIAFDKMGQEEFGVFFRNAVNVIIQLIVNLDLQDLLNELDDMLA